MKGRKPKLTPEQVAEVRDMYSTKGDWSIRQIALLFKIDQAIVHRVLNRKGPYSETRECKP